MLPENYGPGDWPNEQIEMAKALWSEPNTHCSWQRLQQEKSAGADAWMIYLNDARASFSMFKSYA